MQRLFLTLFALLLCIALPMQDADARRLGGGRSYGMQRPVPMKREATPNPSQAPQPRAPQPRSWMGPLAGLAAGIGLAALLSHFGLGAGMASVLMLVVLVLAAFMLAAWFMRRSQVQPIPYAGAAPPNPMLATPNAGTLPEGFDVDAFERQAKVNFLRLQAANDACNLDDIREFTSPEMFAEIKLDIDERRGAIQRTDVITLDAKVLEAEVEGRQQIVSVRFHGMLREDSEQTTPFDETWHLTRPIDASHGWVVAGIQQNA